MVFLCLLVLAFWGMQIDLCFLFGLFCSSLCLVPWCGIMEAFILSQNALFVRLFCNGWSYSIIEHSLYVLGKFMFFCWCKCWDNHVINNWQVVTLLYISIVLKFLFNCSFLFQWLWKWIGFGMDGWILLTAPNDMFGSNEIGFVSVYKHLWVLQILFIIWYYGFSHWLKEFNLKIWNPSRVLYLIPVVYNLPIEFLEKQSGLDFQSLDQLLKRLRQWCW